MAVGSQTNGSIIRPAAFCGVVGFKPSMGRLPRDGMFEFSKTLDQPGGFARSVRDVAALAAAMAGDDLERWWSDDTATPRFAAVRTAEWAKADDAARARFQSDVDRIAAAGGPIEWPDPPEHLDEAPDILRAIMLYEAARAPFSNDVQDSPDVISETLEFALGEGAAFSDDYYERQLRRRLGLIGAFTEWASRYDAILTPATIGEAPTPETTGDPRFCSRWSLVGAPAIVLPSGLGPHRLPLGLQLVGAPGDDRRLLAAAAWCEARLEPIGSPDL
jgi:Asp-tRNA(Asn)/Glu-tRNA(Gln) amidotransferase A subunit family amidase